MLIDHVGMKLAAGQLGLELATAGEARRVLALADLDADGLVTFEEFVIAVQSELPDVRNKKRRTGEGKNNKCDGFLFLFSPRLLGSLAFFPIMKSLPTDRPTA